jgi:hypothetical protein
MGTPVWWMVSNGLTNGSLIDLELDDDDHDGMAAWQEWRAFTDPTNAASALVFTGVSSTGGNVVVQWQSATGPTYAVLRGAAPDGTSTQLATGVIATPPINVWTDTTATAVEPFYRIVVEP